MNLAILTEYLLQMLFCDVLRQALNHNLFVRLVTCAAQESITLPGGRQRRTFVLLNGLSLRERLRPRLGLRALLPSRE